MNSEAVRMDVAELLTGFQHNVLRSDWSDRSGLCHRWQQKISREFIITDMANHWYLNTHVVMLLLIHSPHTPIPYLPVHMWLFLLWLYMYVFPRTISFPFRTSLGFTISDRDFGSMCDDESSIESNVRGLRGTIYMRKVHETQYTPDGTFILYYSLIGVLLDTVRTSISTAVILCHNHV